MCMTQKYESPLNTRLAGAVDPAAAFPVEEGLSWVPIRYT